MTKYFQKLRSFLRARRRTRRKATWQNIVIALLLAVICITALNEYTEENTFDNVVADFCSVRAIDNAELCALVTFEIDGMLSKNVTLRKYTGENEFFEAEAEVVKVNPLKWQAKSGTLRYDVTPYIWEYNADKVGYKAENTYDFSQLGIPGISFIDLYGLYYEETIYSIEEEIMVDITDTEDGTVVNVTVKYSWGSKNPLPYKGFSLPDQNFAVNLDTDECRTVFPSVQMRRNSRDFESPLIAKELWISDDVLIKATETIAKVITSVQ